LLSSSLSAAIISVQEICSYVLKNNKITITYNHATRSWSAARQSEVHGNMRFTAKWGPEATHTQRNINTNSCGLTLSAKAGRKGAMISEQWFPRPKIRRRVTLLRSFDSEATTGWTSPLSSELAPDMASESSELSLSRKDACAKWFPWLISASHLNGRQWPLDNSKQHFIWEEN
jgi:hypothetical protein